MNPRASTKHLNLPLFDAAHREIGNCLADWLPKQSIDESDDRVACKAWVKLLGANQWLTYCAPSGPNGAHGGAFEKIDSRSLVILRENLAFHSALADFAFAMQGLGSGAISLAGSPELQKNYLPQVARGEKIAAFALSEPDAGSDVAAMKTIAVCADSMPASGQFDYEINGLKTWISNGGMADFYCVFAKTDKDAGSRGISAFVVDAATQGLDDSEHIQVMAPHPLAVLKFNHCKVSALHMLGEENGGFKIAMATLDIFRPSVAAAALGFARRALHEARAYAQSRPMFGKTLADSQITQAKLGEMVALIDAGALLTYRAAWMRDVALPAGDASREDYTAAAAMAKMVATENANKVIDMALQMHGGMGVKVGMPIEALYRDIRALRIYEGATEVQQLILGKVCSYRSDLMKTAQPDSFVRDQLPAPEHWPEYRFDRPELQFPAQLNAVEHLLDRAVSSKGFANNAMLRSVQRSFTYLEAQLVVNRIAAYLIEDCQLVPGNRVLLRGPNSMGMALCWLAVVKAGLVAVASMPLLRAKELGEIISKAQPALALCDGQWLAELDAASNASATPLRTICFNSEGAQDLGQLCASKSGEFIACPTLATDVAMMAFTSGTTGLPKAAVHLHRDLLAACECWPRHVLKAQSTDIIIGSPPLAFTFGLGGLLLFPMWAGASVYFHDKAYTPEIMVDVINSVGATISYTAPTFYRQMAAFAKAKGIPSLRISVSAGEGLPDATRQLWKEATGLEMLDGIGATELFHIFISSAGADVKRGAIGNVVPGYTAKVVDDAGIELPRGQVGKLAVVGPTGCKYLADARQANYVKNGWNYPGDAFTQDDDGYFFYQARADDMIVSAGYNIGGPEVEDCLLKHPAVAECGVIGAPHEERGMIVKAVVVLKAGHAGDDEMVKTLQEHVKASIAPYKYPREIEFRTSLPRTETGKLQRFKLRATI